VVVIAGWRARGRLGGRRRLAERGEGTLVDGCGGGGVHVEVENEVDRERGTGRAVYQGRGVDGPDLGLDSGDLVGLDQVNLVEQNHVRRGKLPKGAKYFSMGSLYTPVWEHGKAYR